MEITVFLPLVQTPSHLVRSLRDRVGCHAWQQLGNLGVGHFGRNQRGVAYPWEIFRFCLQNADRKICKEYFKAASYTFELMWGITRRRTP